MALEDTDTSTHGLFPTYCLVSSGLVASLLNSCLLNRCPTIASAMIHKMVSEKCPVGINAHYNNPTTSHDKNHEQTTA